MRADTDELENKQQTIINKQKNLFRALARSIKKKIERIIWNIMGKCFDVPTRNEILGDW